MRFNGRKPAISRRLDGVETTEGRGKEKMSILRGLLFIETRREMNGEREREERRGNGNGPFGGVFIQFVREHEQIAVDLRGLQTRLLTTSDNSFVHLTFTT